MPAPPLDYPVQLGIAYLFLAGYFFRTLFVNLRLPGSVGVIVSGFIYSFFFQEDLFHARDKLQSLAFFLVLLTAGLEIKFQDLKLHVFLLAMAPSSVEVLAISTYSMCALDFSLMEGLVLGSVLVALGDGLVIPKMKEFGEAFPDHPMPRLVFTWAPVEASFILAVFGILGGLAHPADEPDIEPSILVFANIFRIAATLTAAACMGGTCAWLISRRRKSLLDFTGLPVEAFLMVLATALFAFGLGQESEVSTPVPLGFSPGSAFQPELLVILTGSFFAAFSDPHVLHDVEKILGGVWIFGQLVLFTMLGSKTSLDLFGKVTSVLPMMVVGLTARFLGILLVMASTCQGRRRDREDILNDTIFGFLSMLPRATIQGALGAVPEARRFFSDQSSNRDHARAFIFDAARLYIVLMSVGGMVMLNTFGYKMLERQSKDRVSESESEATQESAEVIRSVAVLAKLYDLSSSYVQDLAEDLALQDAKRSPAEDKVMYEVRHLLEERNALFEAERVLTVALQRWDEERRRIVLASREARMLRQQMCFFNRIGFLCREDRSDPTVWQTIDQGSRQASIFKVSNKWPEQPVLHFYAKASLPSRLSNVMLVLNELSLWDEWCPEANLRHAGGGSSRRRQVQLSAALESESLDFSLEVQRFDDPSSGLVAEHLEGRSLQHDGAVLAIIRNLWVACGDDYTVLVQFGSIALQKGLAQNDLVKSSDLHTGFRFFTSNLAAALAKVESADVQAEPWLKAHANHADTLYQRAEACEASVESQKRWKRVEEELEMASPRTPKTPFSSKAAVSDEMSVKMATSNKSPRVSHVTSITSPMRARASSSRSGTLPDDVTAGSRELRVILRCFEDSDLEPIFRREQDEFNESEELVYAMEQGALVEVLSPPALPKHRSAKHLRHKRSMRAWRRREDPLAEFERVRSSSTLSEHALPAIIAPKGRRNSV